MYVTYTYKDSTKGVAGITECGTFYLAAYRKCQTL